MVFQKMRCIPSTGRILIRAQGISLIRMKPLGLRLPVFNRVMLVIYILGILGIALLVPSFRGVSPSNNTSDALSAAVPRNLSFLLAGQEDGGNGEEGGEDGLLAPVLSLNLPATPSPVITPPVSPVSNLTPSRSSVTPFVASLTAMNPVPVPLPADLRPVGSHFEFRDNNRKQVVSVSMENFAAATAYSYHYGDPEIRDIITVPAKLGHRFFFIEVTWDLIGIVGEGKRTSFMTPAVSSYSLINRGISYEPVDPNTIEDILQDAIINVGTLAREESIDKDNPARGVLIYEVPIIVTARESYIEFCPRNTLGLDKPHSPDWDCDKDAVRWSLVP